MAAYAALVSVMHIIEQLKNHPFPPISLDKKQAESLTKNVTFLQEFLEGYPSIGNNQGDDVESRILDAANAAEDVIESHIVDRIHALHIQGKTGIFQKIQRKMWDYTHKIRDFVKFREDDKVGFGQLLQEVIESMDLIKNEVMETKEKMGVRNQLQKKSTSSSSGQTSSSSGQMSSSGGRKQNTTMVGFDDVKLELLDKLTSGGLNRKIISIVGMGGMGKTTLAKTVYEHPLIREHFDIRAWITISQDYNAKKILDDILIQANRYTFFEKNEKQTHDDLYKGLFGRKYLIVMDDMWNIEAWEKIQVLFPDNCNGSRIVVTTRLSNLARQLNSYCLHMRFLDFNESWDLFSKIVRPEMVELGKKIVENCRGLPLSIIVVAGFLAKSEFKKEHWEYIEKNLSSFVNYDSDELCLKILLLSYNQLHVHLKPCFLYMGMFREDSEIRISKLIKLWVAEGFLKPINGKDIEEVAEEYLNDVVDRNLVSIVKSRGRCAKIHDLLRDLCWRQAEVERFYSVVTQHSVTISHNQRRFIVPRATLREEVRNALQSTSVARSVVSYHEQSYISQNHRLLRISGTFDDGLTVDDYFRKNMFQLVNLRYLFAQCGRASKLATSFHLLWSLQTLIIQSNGVFTMPAEIWNLHQLRHVQGDLVLPDPPVCNTQDGIMLENLHTLKQVLFFRRGEELVKRIPNVEKLGLEYVGSGIESCLPNLEFLHKLKSFSCRSFESRWLDGTDFLQKLSFPRSLKKLALRASYVHWEDMMEKIGSLPLLQKLDIANGFFTAHAWETVEGQFPSLKYLKISSCQSLESWNSECSHFPCLEHLVLHNLQSLKEIPLCIGEIPTLRLIELEFCCKSAVISCKRIQEEHEELYGEEEGLRVRVQDQPREYDGLQNLASRNFEFLK